MDDLDKEYQKILIDSYDKSSSQTSSNRKKLLMPTPRKIFVENQVTPSTDKSKVSFGLLTRKGKTTDIKQLQLPSDTKFAESVLKEKEHQRQDRERIMKLVSNME